MLLMPVIYKNSFTKDAVDPCLYKMKAPVFSAIHSRMHTKPFLREEQQLSHRMLIFLQMQTPIIFLSCFFSTIRSPSLYSTIAKTIKGVLNQKQQIHWYLIASSQQNDLARLRQAHPALDHQLAHLSPVQYKQPHQLLDIPAKVVVQHKPNAFLKTMLHGRFVQVSDVLVSQTTSWVASAFT